MREVDPAPIKAQLCEINLSYSFYVQQSTFRAEPTNKEAHENAINVFQIPKTYSLQAAGPIFCSGITMYTPLKQWGALKGGMNVGVVGIGGLGQVTDLYSLLSR